MFTMLPFNLDDHWNCSDNNVRKRSLEDESSVSSSNTLPCVTPKKMLKPFHYLSPKQKLKYVTDVKGTIDQVIFSQYSPSDYFRTSFAEILHEVADRYSAEVNNQYKTNVPGLKRVTLWTDGSPNQFKCRQNFFFLSHRLTDINAIHNFGATSQFKGVHDKVGEIAKRVIRNMERASNNNARCNTALEWFDAAKRAMPAPLKEYETLESKIKKGPFAATSYTWWYATSNLEEVEWLRQGHRDVLVINRSLMWDSTPVKGTQSKYQFRNDPTQGTALLARFLPCPCEKCTMGEINQCTQPEITGNLEKYNLKFKEPKLKVNTENSTAINIT